MSSHRFSDQESAQWFDAVSQTNDAPRQMPARASFARGQTERVSRRTTDANMSHQVQEAEDWASECLFECYNG